MKLRVSKYLLFNVGCLFFSACSTSTETYTFTEHVSPIVFTKCATCHRLDHAGPFPLTTYQQVVKRADAIKFVVNAKMMPPWPANPSYSHFLSEKTLTAQEIEVVTKWIEGGCLPGDTSTLHYTPTADAVFSNLGKPDLILKMPHPFLLKGNSKDKFYLMKFPYELDRDTFIKSIVFVPGNRKLVHHVNGFIIQYDEGKKKNVFDGDWYVDTDSVDVKTGYEILKLANDDGTYPMLTPSVCNYLPGVEGVMYPNGIGGFSIKRSGAIFLKDIHYGPSRINQFDSSYFAVYFDSKPPKRRTLEFQLGTLGVSAIEPKLVIPPNQEKTFSTHLKIPIDISVLTINPHMHLLGKSYKAYAIKPSGDTIPLISIPKWDFNWQYFYTFPQMLKIPAGSVVWAIGTFDNTTKNPNNPFSPPRTVAERDGSMRTTDEMFQFIVTYLPYQKGDENISLQPN